jgi:D-alanyl-lipoteichoic acid acyltransferase DltB (MBOAT superfamily)
VLFPTVTFAAFFLLVFTVSWLLMPRPPAWKLFMIGASYVFYGVAGWAYCLLIAASTVVNQVCAVGVARSRGRARTVWLVAAVVIDLGVLGWFKYYGFFASQLQNFLHLFGLGSPLPLLDIVLPVGVSFLTFRAISYVIDVYRGKVQPGPHLDVALYFAFFPYMMAGPIVRAADLLPQLTSPRDPRRIDSGRALWLIFAGLVKKMLIADFLASHIINGVFSNPGGYSSLEVLLGVYAYSVQIYCDFSGYTDMAIGIGMLLGFQFPQNFNSPYAAVSVQDFWRRWHMTLSSWLRDYLYIPLGGNRNGQRRTSVNIMVTMLLGGLWHGAAWTFVAWGGLHGGAQVVEHWFRDRRTARGLPLVEPSRGGRIVRRILVFHFITLAWIFFRADSFGDAAHVIGRLFTAWGVASPNVTVALVGLIFAGIAMQYVPSRLTDGIQAGFSRLRPVMQGLACALGLFVVSALGPQGPSLFLYFKF